MVTSQLPDALFYQAFASQAVMSIQHLHIPFESVNPVGGAIAIGHPLGCTGARQIATAFSEAKREKKKIFVTSMCIGSGMVSFGMMHKEGDLLLIC